jgi:hypothetical protein
LLELSSALSATEALSAGLLFSSAEALILAMAGRRHLNNVTNHRVVNVAGPIMCEERMATIIPLAMMIGTQKLTRLF